MRARLGIPVDAPVIGGVFRLYPEKRPLLWIEVARHVARSHPEAWFVMVGQGILKREIEQTARRFGIVERLLLPGVVDNVLPMMRAFDVFLLTSFGEGLPNVVLEAQSAGLPVVATNAGGVVEAVQPGVTGWIVDSPNAELLAERVTALLDQSRAALAIADCRADVDRGALWNAADDRSNGADLRPRARMTVGCSRTIAMTRIRSAHELARADRNSWGSIC